MQRRVMSCTGPTLLPLDRNKARVLTVAVGSQTALQLIGFVALSDPPRDDAASLIAELKTLGVRTLMVTGDARTTAQIVAKAVGLGGPVCPAALQSAR